MDSPSFAPPPPPRKWIRMTTVLVVLVTMILLFALNVVPTKKGSTVSNRVSIESYGFPISFDMNELVYTHSDEVVGETTDANGHKRITSVLGISLVNLPLESRLKWMALNFLICLGITIAIGIGAEIYLFHPKGAQDPALVDEDGEVVKKKRKPTVITIVDGPAEPPPPKPAVDPATVTHTDMTRIIKKKPLI